MNGVVGGGELREIWDHEWGKDQPCGCGESLADCPFWSGVKTQLQINRRQGFLEQMQTERSRARDRHLPLLLLPRREQICRSRYNNYLRGLKQLYDAMCRQAGESIVVDSSKSPLYGYLLTLLPETNVHIIHMIRDARGTDFSLWKRKLRSDVSGFEYYRSSLGALQWNLLNMMSEVLRSCVPPSRFFRVRYEDFAREPKTTTASILRHIKHHKAESLPFRDDQTVHLDATHTVGGNAKRLQTGDIEIRLDDKWKTESPTTNVMMTTLLSGPLLAYYGYPLWSEVW